MALVTAYKAVVVTTPAADQVLKVASITAPTLLLAVRVLTTTAVFDASDAIRAEIGVCNNDMSLFFPIPFAIIPATAIKFTNPRVVLQTPDFGVADGSMPNKPSWWAVRYRPSGYSGVVAWHAKLYFDTLR